MYNSLVFSRELGIELLLVETLCFSSFMRWILLKVGMSSPDRILKSYHLKLWVVQSIIHIFRCFGQKVQRS
jgi:hypothetical protein